MTLGFFFPHLVRKDITERASSSTDSGDSAGKGFSMGYKSLAGGICCNETRTLRRTAAGVSQTPLRRGHRASSGAKVVKDLVVLDRRSWSPGNECSRDPGETGCCVQVVSLGQSVTWSFWWFGLSSSAKESLMPTPSWWAQEPFQVQTCDLGTSPSHNRVRALE